VISGRCVDSALVLAPLIHEVPTSVLEMRVRIGKMFKFVMALVGLANN